MAALVGGGVLGGAVVGGVVVAGGGATVLVVVDLAGVDDVAGVDVGEVVEDVGTEGGGVGAAVEVVGPTGLAAVVVEVVELA